MRANAHKIEQDETWKSPDGTGFNDFPVGWRLISEAELAGSDFFSYMPVALEHRQMHNVPSDPSAIRPEMVDAWLYWMEDGTGFAMERDCRQTRNMKVHYYAFGCQYHWVEISPEEAKKRSINHWGMHCHVMLCRKCEEIRVQDSSG